MHPNDIIINVQNMNVQSPYRIINSILQYPEKLPKGNSWKVLDTHVNLKWLLDELKIVVKYNLMTRKREIYFAEKGLWAEDKENSDLAMINYIATINEFPIKQIDQHLDYLADKNAYHPIVESIKNNPWDGISRLDDFILTIKAQDPELAKKIIKTWMVAAVAAAHSQDGFINHGVLVIHGAQRIGKTAWVKSLEIPNSRCVKDGAFLDPNSKDSILQLSEYWINELGEVDSIFKKSEIGRLKSFITMQYDDIRKPYARRSTRFPRRSAYIATVNEQKFLHDETGNRRWWTITAISINYEHKFDMQQVWSEAYGVWQSGHLTYLPEELQVIVNNSNETYEAINPLEEKLAEFYAWGESFNHWLSATGVLEEMGYFRPTKADSTKMGNLLKKFCGCNPKKTKFARIYPIPRIMNNNDKIGDT